MMGTPSQPGITPLAVQEMFALIRRMSGMFQTFFFSFSWQGGGGCVSEGMRICMFAGRFFFFFRETFLDLISALII